MKWSVGSKIGAGFALALAALALLGVTSYRSTSGLIDAAELRSHTFLVLANLESLVVRIRTVESTERGYLITGEDTYLQSYAEAARGIDPGLEALRKLTADNPAQQRRLDALTPFVHTRMEQFATTIDQRKNKRTVDVVLPAKGKQVMEDIQRMVDAMEEEERTLLQVRDQRVNLEAQRTLSIIVFGIPVAILGVALVAIWITRNIAIPLGRITDAASQISAGNLGVQFERLDRADEVGKLSRTFGDMIENLQKMAGLAARIAGGDLTVKIQRQSERDELGSAFGTMVNNLREVTSEIREGANVVAASAGEIVASTSQVAAGSVETATAVSQTTTTVEQVKQTAQLSTEKARQVADGAQRTAQISQEGRKAVDDAIEAMHRIQRQVESIAESIVRLSEQSQAIGEIIATVNDLAEQSNLLSVNAAVEAAKAGDHGKGFSVVAQEVKSLAAQSKQATAQVRSILGDIQKATTVAVMATEQGSKAVDEGVKLSGDVRHAIRSLVESIDESARAATQIVASAQQQMIGMDQVAAAMQSIKQASVQNVAGTKQSESAAQNLRDLGQKLKQVVEQYRL